MDCIQTIESLNQDDRHGTSIPQILDYVKDFGIHPRSFMHQEKACKDTKMKGIEMMGTFCSR